MRIAERSVKTNEVGRHTFPDFKIYYNISGIKKVPSVVKVMKQIHGTGLKVHR